MDLSITEAATHLGVSADTVRRRIKAGKLDSLKQNGQWRVNIGDADAPADDLGHAQGTSGLVDVLLAQIATKDEQIERLHTLLMQTALAPAPAEQKQPWFKFWK
jgi:excisionase family DNA binding protein|tara:strand:+ start:321 stop:632 length:312 start_codon:yes stop_codon:yes gene_type:complete